MLGVQTGWREGRKNILVEVVPKNTSRIFHDSNISCYVRLVILHQRDTFALPGVTEETSKIVESRETPIPIVGRESVSCNCDLSEQVVDSGLLMQSLTM